MQGAKAIEEKEEHGDFLMNYQLFSIRANSKRGLLSKWCDGPE